MSDSPDEKPAEPGEYLAPLPKRVMFDDEGQGAIDGPLDQFVREMLERANVLLSTLDNDVGSLRKDQEEAIAQVESEWEQRKADAAVADELLDAMRDQANELAQRKGRAEALAQALRAPVDPKTLRPLGVIVDDIEHELKLAQGITGAIRLETIGRLLREAAMSVELMQREADKSRQALLAETERDLDAEVVEASASFEIGSGIIERDVAMLAANLAVSAVAFDDPRWIDWEPVAELAPSTRLGTYSRPGMGDLAIPWLMANPVATGLLIEPGAFRDEVAAGMRSLLLRLLAGAPPGSLRCTIIDPVGLGDVAGALLDVLEFEPTLLDGGVATTEEDIHGALERSGAHVERVVQQYLRGRYESLAACNEAAGEILEPYRVLLVMDYPNGFDQASQAKLRRLVDNGARAGLFPIVVRDPSYRPAFGGPKADSLAEMEKVTANAEGLWRDEGVAGTWQVSFDSPPSLLGSDDPTAGLIERIAAAVGQSAQSAVSAGLAPSTVWRLLGEARAARARSDLPAMGADVDPLDPQTWWHADAEPSITVPIGRSGVRDVATLHLSDGGQAGALIVGQHGSGVTTVLHNLVCSGSQLYPADGVDFYLVALGNRATFTPAATVGLPHARLVADTAEREVGLDLLERFVARVEAHQAGRVATNDEGEADAPRSVLVIDGLEELIGTDDLDGRRAVTLIEQLLHDGGDAGVQLVCVLRPSANDPKLTLDCISRLPVASFGTRLALDVPDPVMAALVGSVEVEEVRPARPGDALVLTGPLGEPRVRSVRLTHLDDRARYQTFRSLREHATSKGVSNRPQIYDGSSPARLELSPLHRLLSNTDQRTARLQARLWVGEPATLGDPVEITLSRQEGANLLIVGDDLSMGCGTLISALTSAVLVHGAGLDVRVLDFTPLDSGLSEAAGSFEQHWPVHVERRRNVAKVLDHVHRAISDRLADSDFRKPPVLLMIAGLDRARDLAEPEGQAVRSDGPDLHRLLRQILSDGPEAGVHTLAWASTLPLLERRVGTEVLREFAVRIAGRMPEDASQALLDTPAAANLGDHQAMLYDEDWGRVMRFRPFILPPASWLTGLARAAAGVNPDQD